VPVPCLRVPFPNHETSHIIPPPQAPWARLHGGSIDPRGNRTGCPEASLSALAKEPRGAGKSRKVCSTNPTSSRFLSRPTSNPISSSPGVSVMGSSPRDSDEFLTAKIS
jgi:hypothetical protein